MLSEKAIRAGILGLCVGDALGVPVEFRSRASLKADPATEMRGHGTEGRSTPVSPKPAWRGHGEAGEYRL